MIQNNAASRAMNSERGQQRSDQMMTAILPESGDQLKTPEISRLVDVLDQLPAEDRAEVWRGVALNLAARLDPEQAGVRS